MVRLALLQCPIDENIPSHIYESRIFYPIFLFLFLEKTKGKSYEKGKINRGKSRDSKFLSKKWFLDQKYKLESGKRFLDFTVVASNKAHAIF